MAEEVKYLSFIQRSAESIYGYAEAGYAKLKDSVKVPQQFKELFDSVEGRLEPVLSTILVPYSLGILRFADSLVRIICFRSTYCGKVLAKPKVLGPTARFTMQLGLIIGCLLHMLPISFHVAWARSIDVCKRCSILTLPASYLSLARRVPSSLAHTLLTAHLNIIKGPLAFGSFGVPRARWHADKRVTQCPTCPRHC